MTGHPTPCRNCRRGKLAYEHGFRVIRCEALNMDLKHRPWWYVPETDPPLRTPTFRYLADVPCTAFRAIKEEPE